MSTPTVALISATPLAIGPAQEAMKTRLPDYEIWNILDDRLLVDAQTQGKVTPELHRRMNRLIDHALAGGAHAILLTCSLYGFVTAEYSDSPVPVLPPDQAAFDDVTGTAAEGVTVVGSLEAATSDSADRLRAHSASVGRPITVTRLVVPEAAEAAKAGNPELLADILTSAIRGIPKESAVFLAQYSLAPAVGPLTKRLNRPVFSGPSSAANAIATSLRSSTEPGSKAGAC